MAAFADKLLACSLARLEGAGGEGVVTNTAERVVDEECVKEVLEGNEIGHQRQSEGGSGREEKLESAKLFDDFSPSIINLIALTL